MTNLFRIVLPFCLLPIFSVPVCEAVGEETSSGLSALVDLLSQVDDTDLQLDLLIGMHQGLAGRRSINMPSGWPAAYKSLSQSDSAGVRDKALELALIFGDPQAAQALRSVALDKTAAAAARDWAIHSLAQNNIAGTAPLLRELLDDAAVQAAALRGLAAFDDPATPSFIVGSYQTFSPDAKRDAIQTLASRPAFANILLDAIEQRQIASTDVSAYTARQLQTFGDVRISERLATLWGDVKQTSEQQMQLIERYKEKMTPEILQQADFSNGKLVFEKNCLSCHMLYGEGGKIGPDITGGNRDNLDYVLENVLAPSAAVARDYQVTNILTIGGRVLSGIITAETNNTVTIQMVNEQVIIDKSEVDDRSQSPLSMMPDGLADKLSDAEFRDLIAYLARKTPLP